MRPPGTMAGLRVAYLNSQYPCLSHTFIEREIGALRALGVDVETFSIRPPDRNGVLGSAHARAAEETYTILDGAVRPASAGLAALANPLGFGRAMAACQRLAPPGFRSRSVHLAYAVEAVCLAREMRARGLRHVHCHMANNGAAVAMLACAFDPSLSYSLSIHGSAEFFHVDTWTLAPKVEGATFVRCISDFCRAQVMAWTNPACWERLHVVHCGIDTARFAPVDRPARGPLRLLTVGRMNPIKGYPLLLEACRALDGEGLDWTLDMVGDGEILPSLKDLAARLGISSRVRFSGAVGQDDILAHYRDADVIVVSSFMEGVPVVLMEGMASGLAVLTTAVGGVPELVDAGVSGVVVPPGSSAALARGLRSLARDRAALTEMGRRGRERILSDFSIQHTGTAMRDLLGRYLGVLERTS